MTPQSHAESPRALHQLDPMETEAINCPSEGSDPPKRRGLPAASGARLDEAGARGHFGIALSGGGIRSATFNLGLLQGLDRLGVLADCDYLSTVSGGGYIGGWWSAWLARRADTVSMFPNPHAPDGRLEIERLRSYSNYLAPRPGILDLDLWLLVGTYLRALVGSLLIAGVMLALVLEAWRGGTWLLRYCWRLAVELAMAANPAEWIGAVAAAAAPRWWTSRSGWAVHSAIVWMPAAIAAAAVVVALAARRANKRRAPHQFPAPPTVSAPVDGLPFWERMLARTAAGAALWTMLALNWQFSGWLAGRTNAGWLVASVAASSGCAFGWLGRALPWTVHLAVRTGSGIPLRSARTAQIVAHTTLFLGLALVGVAIRRCEQSAPVWTTPVVLAAGVLLWAMPVVWRRAPVSGGLHALFRRRISMAYLQGASGPGSGAAQARPEALHQLPARPLHLICCTASDLGRRSGSLGRRGRSCAFSKWGMTLGEQAAPAGELALDEAIAASASAISPSMGEFTQRLGPAVSLLAAALGLRLGFWLRNPLVAEAAWWSPLVAQLNERLGRMGADGAWLHLTDGGHFENLGLYELLRRRCRWILVSDCGADADFAFADLGNALRKAREDFGIEIEIDLAPLRPDRLGHSARHWARGTIRYTPGQGGNDGQILLVKPALTGDEAVDIASYRAAHRRFPHESTGDQFFDEAQWESYRALGEHSAMATRDWAHLLLRRGHGAGDTAAPRRAA